jgi:hypothetical protein
MRRWLAAALVLSAVPVLAQEAVKSGPQPGAILPGSVAPLNLNGKVCAGRHHCLVCEFNLDPVLLVFAREPAPGKNMVLNDFLQQIDKAIDRHELNFLKSFVVFLSPDARSSVTDPDIEDTVKLVDEATKRKKLIEQLKPRLEATRNIQYAVFPAEGPKGYNIDPRAEVTVVFYKRHRVLANFAFAAEKLNAGDIDAILRTVDKLVTVEPLEK